MNVNFLDCTLRDGGYYNAWDFSPKLINDYMRAMAALSVDMVEIGLRSMSSAGSMFKGGCAYCTDEYIHSLRLPDVTPSLAVMVNGADLLNFPDGVISSVAHLFGPADSSPVRMVRIACHVDKVAVTLPAIARLRELGYQTTVNLMQIAGLSQHEVEKLAYVCVDWPIDVLYFADSMGSMLPADINRTVAALRTHWAGELGFHAHNNMEWGLANCLRAMEQGVSWIDATVLGMGRGPGNARTEYLAIELEGQQGRMMNLIPLLDLIDKYFRPMQQKYGWGPNPYYYLAGKYGIHPTYVQEMISDSRYDGEDILAVINHLKSRGGKQYNLDILEASRNFYKGVSKGSWRPAELIAGREVLLLGAGPGVETHRKVLEDYIRRARPLVIALNTQSRIDQDLIDLRVACHPIRLLADVEEHSRLPQPLISPVSMLPGNVRDALVGKETLDYGLEVQADTFTFGDTHCVLPKCLVVAYSLAVASSGGASRVLLAGFDGYGADDPRTSEMQELITTFKQSTRGLELLSVTPTRYNLPIRSIYSM
jgi:4-hydroxy 2-oxovalerate aldolase